MQALTLSCIICGSTDGDVQQRAGQGNARYCDDCSMAFSRQCREMEVVLPADLGAQIAVLFGSESHDVSVTGDTSIDDGLDALPGVSDEVIQNLRSVGFETMADLRTASAAAFLDISGIDADLADAIAAHLDGCDGDDADIGDTSD